MYLTSSSVTAPPCLNPLAPDDSYSGRTALLTSKVAFDTGCAKIKNIYSTNIGTEYFKHGISSPFFPLQNAVCFIILTCLVPVLFTFYLQGMLKFKNIYIYSTNTGTEYFKHGI
jgi:hypothetical protein